MKIEAGSLSGPVLFGEILEGEINEGMFESVWVDSELYQYSEVIGIEYVDYPGGKQNIGLVLSFSDKEAKEVFCELCQEGDVIEISESI